MLRITVMQSEERTALKAEGKLSGPWVKELERCWQTASTAPSARQILVDLTDVTFVDRSGRDLIQKMCKSGVRVTTAGPLMTAMIREISAANRRA